MTENNQYSNRRRSERTLMAFTECCNILLNSSSELELLNNICQIVCDTGGYRMAYVGYAENNSDKSVTPLAYSGFEDGYLSSINLSWADNEFGRGPTGTAIRENRIEVNRNFASNPIILPWREEAMKRGYYSSIAIPLALDGYDRPIGALMIYSSQADAFDHYEIELLKALANYISHGIISIRRNNIRLKVEEENSRLAAVLNATSDFVGIADPKGRLLYYNPAAKKMLGLENDKDISKIRISDTHPEWANQIVEREIFPALFKDGCWSGETALLDKNGQEIPISHLALAQKDSAGKIEFIAIIARDITERKQLEKELQLSKEKYRRIIESSMVGKFMTEKDLIIYANPKFAQIFGYDRDEILNLSLLNLLSEEKSTIELLFTGLAAGDIEWFHIQVKGIKKNGSLIYIELEMSTIHYLNSMVSAGTVIDITQRKMIETELIRSREEYRLLSARIQAFMEEERGRISREIHDELGQALTALKMDLRWIKKSIFSDENRLDLLKILTRLQEMSSQIDEAIQVGRRIAYDLRPSILDDIGIIEAISWHTQYFQQKTDIECELSTNLKHIDMDKNSSTAIFRIFQETLTNIARHSRANRVCISIKRQVDCIKLEVKDNGKGICTNDINSGSLGILGMKERVQPLGGRIEIKGKKGKGTTVILTVPLQCMEGKS